MDKNEALKSLHERLKYYGGGTYKGYEEIVLPDGEPGVRFTYSLSQVPEKPSLSAEGYQVPSLAIGLRYLRGVLEYSYDLEKWFPCGKYLKR